MNKEVVLSIITPCYNQGQYINEIIESIQLINTPYSFEHIIINDGSSDELTVRKLEDLSKNGFKIIHQKNMGLATARNNAISVAKGKYILPLDADNKLHENYLTKAIDILEKENKIDIVYGNAIYFEDENKLYSPGEFEFASLLKANYIDTCAVFKKAIWQKVGGYDPFMPAMGNEDWEFWINCFLQKANFFYLNQECFYYRVRNDSMSVITTRPAFALNRAYILNKHIDAILNYYVRQIGQLQYMNDFYTNHRFRTAAKLLLNPKFKL